MVLCSDTVADKCIINRLQASHLKGITPLKCKEPSETESSIDIKLRESALQKLKSSGACFSFLDCASGKSGKNEA